MPTFSAHDGTKLAYHVFGDGPPVVCLPGGPTDSACLGDLEHLGLDRMNLLAHCAGANVAALYVSRHPENVAKLTLITPSVKAVGLTIPGELRLRTAQLRRNERWFPEAFAALEAIVAGKATADSWKAIAPFSDGRWDEAAQAHQAAGDERMAEFADLFPNAELVVQPGAGHHPWLDDADRFVMTTAALRSSGTYTGTGLTTRRARSAARHPEFDLSSR